MIAGLGAAGFATAVLVVNNIRDREADANAGKRTLAVLLEYHWSRVEFLALLGLSYLSPLVLWAGFEYASATLLTLLSLPPAIPVLRTVLTSTDGPALNPALENLGKVFGVSAFSFSGGLVLPIVL